MTQSIGPRRRIHRARMVTLGLAAAIAVVTLTPSAPSGGGIPGLDKVFHGVGFALLAFPLSFVRPRSALWVILAAIAYGALIEGIQPTFGRSAEWADLLADAVGAIAGAGIGVVIARRSGAKGA